MLSTISKKVKFNNILLYNIGMSKSRIIIAIAFCIALLPVLGFPGAWEAFFQVLAGLSIIGLSIWSTIDRKLAQKAKAHLRHKKHKEVQAIKEEVSETIPTSVFIDQNVGNLSN